MAKAKDLTGQKFGKLTAIANTGIRGGGGLEWICIGNIRDFLITTEVWNRRSTDHVRLSHRCRAIEGYQSGNHRCHPDIKIGIHLMRGASNHNLCEGVVGTDIGVYGIDGTQVKYTVQYLLSGTTTKLAPDGTFYAGVGDRPISSYIYIEGYIPANRSTRTLVSDESQNVLVCYYNAPAAPAGTAAGGAAAGAAVAGAGAAVAGANAAGGAANAAAAGANAANPVQANPANPTVAGANAVNPNAAAPAPAPQQQYAQTEDILDLDVPLAAPEGSALPSSAPAVPAISAPPVIQPQDANKTGLPNWALVGGGVVGVGLIALLYWYLLFYRKKKKYADIDDLFRD